MKPYSLGSDGFRAGVNRKTIAIVTAGAIAAGGFGIRLFGQQDAVAHPIDPVEMILESFKSHSVVALAEGDHGNLQGHEFRLALARAPQFSDLVHDIVVEAGNSRYQDVMDRFIRGEVVADADLRAAWQNTTIVR